MRKTVVLLGLVAGTIGAAQAQTAGVVQFVAGEVKLLQAGGSERAARKGVPVSVGDTLQTAPGGLAQLKMGDGAIVVVQPGSSLTVAEFHFAGVEDGNEKVRYRLERGGFRAVTGAIGRTHKQNYLIETPIAHMGVRGTDHESYYFPATGPVEGDGAKPGAYNKVNTGMTFIRTSAGEVEISPNQVGYVASAGEVPQILLTVPGFFNRSIAPRNAGRSLKPAPDAAEVAHVERAPDESLANEVRLLRTRGPRVTPGSGQGPLVAFSKQAGMSGGGFGESGNGVTVEVDSNAQSTTGSFGTTINWTTWSGGEVKVGGVKTVGATQVIWTTDKTDLAALPALVSATYSYSGVGPAPTNQAGTPGVINSLNVGVNFSNQMIDSYNLTATADGTRWNSRLNTTAPHSITNFTDAGGIRLTGTCTTCGGTTSGTAHGTFVGSQAENLITTFGLSGSGNQSLNGAAVLSRPLP